MWWPWVPPKKPAAPDTSQPTIALAQQGEPRAQREEIEQLRVQLTARATELAQPRERIGRSSRNFSKPPSSDGPGFQPPGRRRGSGRKRCGQRGRPGSGPELLPIEPAGPAAGR
ncbi:MAG: DUF6444 domain-containing protein [Cyanobium sp. CZS 25K]|nr:DUF6444 domain-containing protein [Cyanobium sp. CZS25K]